MQDETRAYQVFYSKDLRKKKKIYSEGFLICSQHRAKLFDANGDCLLSLANKHQPELEQEYTLNNTYIVLPDKQIPHEDYISGKLFLPPPPLPIPAKAKVIPKKGSLHKMEVEVGLQFPNGLRIEKFLSDKLRAHQVEGVKFMFECLTGKRGKLIEGCILADFMGLGKTLQTLAVVRCLMVEKVVGKAVVVCPLTLVRVWERECVRWMGGKLSALVGLGGGEEVAKAVRMFVDYDYRLLVVSYETFYRNCEALGKRCDLIIFDEGHRLKNSKTKFFRKLLAFPCRKRVLLTGTPLQNNLSQLYTCIAIVNPLLFHSQALFRNVFQKPILAGMAKGASTQQRAVALRRGEELAQRLKQFSLRRRAEVLQAYLPRKRQHQIFLQPSPLQLLIYQRLCKKKLPDSDALSFLTLLRKLFLHPALFKNDRYAHDQLKDCLEDTLKEHSPKIDFVRALALHCRSRKEKLIVVSYFTESLDFVGEMLKEEGVGLARLDGRVDGKERYRVVESFFKEKDVLLLSGKAGGTGLTLTCACKMVMLEPDWNPSNDSQVMGRVWRQGQEKLVVASSFEEKMLQRQKLKQSLSEKLIDQSKAAHTYDFSSLKQLFIDIQPHCITYTPSSNALPQTEQRFPDLNWTHALHVELIQSHNQGKLSFTNQFEEANFENIQQQDQQEEETADQIDIDGDEIYPTLPEGNIPSSSEDPQKKEAVKQQSQNDETKEEEGQKKLKKEDKIQQLNQSNQSVQTLGSKEGLPLALRKLKKKLKQLN